MARTSRLDQLAPKPPLPPLPEHEEPQEGYRPVGSMAQRAAQGYGIHRPIHVEVALHGAMADIDSRRRDPVDPFFSADLGVVRAVAMCTMNQPGEEYLLTRAPSHGVPVVVEIYDEVIEVRTPDEGEVA